MHMIGANWAIYAKKVFNPWSIRGRSQLLTVMKAYTAYARGEGVWDHRTLSPRKSTFIFNHWQCIIKYCTCLESKQCAHICRSFMYNNTFEALFLTSTCTHSGFLWTQTVAPHICRSFMYNHTFEALFLTSKCTHSGFLWTQTVAPHSGLCMATQRRYRFRSAWADSSL